MHQKMTIRQWFSDNKKRLMELFWYCFYGGVGTILNVIIFYLLTNKANIPYMLSNLIAWIFSIIFAFITNKIWVFKSNSWHILVWIKEFINFMIARIATCIFDMGYMFVAISLCNFDETISKIIANIIVIILNFILSKLWVFK